MPLVFKELSMTRYDFTTQPNRLNQNTMKWHEAESDPELLELWVLIWTSYLFLKLEMR